MYEIENDRIERHVRKMGGPQQSCEGCPGEVAATSLVDGVALCTPCAEDES